MKTIVLVLLVATVAIAFPSNEERSGQILWCGTKVRNQAIQGHAVRDSKSLRDLCGSYQEYREENNGLYIVT